MRRAIWIKEKYNIEKLVFDKAIPMSMIEMTPPTRDRPYSRFRLRDGVSMSDVEEHLGWSLMRNKKLREGWMLLPDHDLAFVVAPYERSMRSYRPQNSDEGDLIDAFNKLDLPFTTEVRTVPQFGIWYREMYGDEPLGKELDGWSGASQRYKKHYVTQDTRKIGLVLDYLDRQNGFPNFTRKYSVRSYPDGAGQSFVRAFTDFGEIRLPPRIRQELALYERRPYGYVHSKAVDEVAKHRD